MTPSRSQAFGKVPPSRSPGIRAAMRWVGKNLFNSWHNSFLTVLVVWLCAYVALRLFWWGWENAAFGTTPESCADIAGACWSVIGDFWRVFLVGLYPQDERWRPFAAFIILAAMLLLCLSGRLRRWRWFYLLWTVAVVGIFVLVRGGVFGLETVSTRNWGGLMITIGLASVGLAVGIPIGILLALGRRSESYPGIKAVCVMFIELVRSVPFIMLLIMGTIMFPMFLPPGWNIDLLLRAQVAIIMSAAANSAEIVRGGLAGVDKGQEEAAKAIGLGYWRIMGLILLPQALRTMIPVFVSMFIIFLKDTSLVVIVGLFDLLGAGTLATGNPKWVGKNIETYVFVAVIYFIMCYTMSRFSRKLERKFRVGKGT